MNEGEKGKCLTCKYCEVNSGRLICRASEAYNSIGRTIFDLGRYTDEEMMYAKQSHAHKKVLEQKRKYLVMEKALNKKNPSWCVYRTHNI